MNEKFLNKTGLTYFYNKIKKLFASQSDFDTLEDKVDEIIAEGGEPNVIESISIDGTAQTITNKNVDLPTIYNQSQIEDFAEGVVNDSIAATATTSIASKEYVNTNGGKIDKIKVNGTEQTITNKEVDLSVPTAVSELTNDSNFQTDTEVEDAINSKLSSTYKAGGSVAFANLPSLTSTNEGKVYNVSDSFTTTADFVEGAGHTYPAGTNVVIINIGTEQSPSYKYDVMSGFVDLSNYWNNTNLVAITTSEIDTIISGS